MVRGYRGEDESKRREKEMTMNKQQLEDAMKGGHSK